MKSATVYGGHPAMIGVDSKTSPSVLSSQYASMAVNRMFRGGENSTRPSFSLIKLEFEESADKAIFENYAIKGVFEYEAVRSNAVSCHLVFCKDRVFKISFFGKTGYVETLIKGLTLTPHAACCQVDTRMYFQNGVDRPFGWDGINDPYQLTDGEDAMPIGIGMFETQGRVVVLTESNHFLVSDHIYSQGVNTNRGAETWVEYQLFKDLGAIPTPSVLGNVKYAKTIKRPDSLNGEGEFFVGCEKGSMRLNFQKPRSEWTIPTVMSIDTTVAGFASQGGVISMVNDIFYQSTDGTIRSIAIEKQNSANSLGYTTISAEVDQFAKTKNIDTLSRASATAWENLMIFSCMMAATPDADGSPIVYGRAMMVADLDQGTRSNADKVFSWNGLWTGLRPTFIKKMGDSAIIYSWSKGRKNEVFTIGGTCGYDETSYGRKQIESWYKTPLLLLDRAVEKSPSTKLINSASLIVSKMDKGSSVSLYSSGPYSNAWTAHQLTDSSIAKGGGGNIYFGGSKTQQQQAYSLKIEIKGCVSIDWLDIEAELTHPYKGFPKSSKPCVDDKDRSSYKILSYLL